MKKFIANLMSVFKPPRPADVFAKEILAHWDEVTEARAIWFFGACCTITFRGQVIELGDLKVSPSHLEDMHPRLRKAIINRVHRVAEQRRAAARAEETKKMMAELNVRGAK